MRVLRPDHTDIHERYQVIVDHEVIGTVWSAKTGRYVNTWHATAPNGVDVNRNRYGDKVFAARTLVQWDEYETAKRQRREQQMGRRQDVRLATAH